MQANVEKMLGSVNACLDLGRFRTATMSEYFVRTPLDGVGSDARARLGVGQCTRVAQPACSKSRIMPGRQVDLVGEHTVAGRARGSRGGSCASSRRVTGARAARSSCSGPWSRTACVPNMWQIELMLHVTWWNTAMRTSPAQSSAVSAPVNVPVMRPADAERDRERQARRRAGRAGSESTMSSSRSRSAAKRFLEVVSGVNSQPTCA